MIPLDQELTWNYGLRIPGEDLYKQDTDLYRKHSQTGNFKVKLSHDGVEASQISVAARSDALESHGWWMWSLWFPVGLMLIATKRWLQGKAWVANHIIHALGGHCVTILTIYQGYKQLERYGW